MSLRCLHLARRAPRHIRQQLALRAFASSSSASSSCDVYTWGTNTNGVLLNPSSQEKDVVFEPTKASLDVGGGGGDEIPSGAKISAVVCGPTDTALVFEDGSLYVAGTNKYGQLGLGHANPVPKLTKVPVEGVSKVSLGMVSSSIIDVDGALHTCGSNGTIVSGLGLLGLGMTDPSGVTRFTKVESLVEDGCLAQDAAWGDSHMTVLTTEGEVLTTGAANYGRLGTGDTSVDQYYLEPVLDVGVGLTNTSAIQIAGGKSFTLALNRDGIIFGWGRNHKGQLGTGFGMAVDMYAMEKTPQPVNDPALSNHELATSGQKVTQIAAGPNHAAAITETGALYWWGMSAHLEPVRAVTLAHETIVQVSCGNDVTMALAESGNVYAWGKNGKSGVLGVGPNPSSTLHQPTLIPASSSSLFFTSVSAGWTHAGGLATVREQEEEKEEVNP